MNDSWFGWIARRRLPPRTRTPRPRRDPRRRPPGVERLEDRLLLTTAAYGPLADDRFIDISDSDDVWCEYLSYDGRTVVDLGACSTNASTGSSSDGQSLFLMGSSDPVPLVADSNDMEFIRIGPNPPSPSAPGDGLVDLTPTLNEPVAPTDRQPSPVEHRAAHVVVKSDRPRSLASSEDGLAVTDSSGGWAAFQLAALLSKHVGTNHRPAGDDLPWLDDSASDGIEGARGISRTLEVATSPDRVAPPAEPRDHAERFWPSAPLPVQSVRSPHQPHGAQPDPVAPDPGPGRVPVESTHLVALREPNARTAHEAVFGEMAEPFADAFFDAIYLDDKRPVHVITLLIAATLAREFSDRSSSPDAPTCLLPPRRRLPPS